MSREPTLLFIAGEVSGDMHAAGLLRAIQKQHENVRAFGIGGDELASAGMEIIHHVRDMEALGFAEILPKIAYYRRVLHEMLALAEERRPDAVILIDYPGFNLRFAAQAHARDLKVIYYICPQVWAWHKSRIPRMAETIDHLITIFPFEPDVFAGTGLRADYAGHPLHDVSQVALAEPPAQLPWDGGPRIAILPGSRRQEVERMLPIFLGAGRLIAQDHTGAEFIIAAPSDEVADVSRQVLTTVRHPPRCAIVSGQTRQVLRQARAALVASGTATLEAALMRCPMVIAYKIAPLSYWCVWRLLNVKRIGMVNIVADELLCPEFIQGSARPRPLADAITPLLEESEERKRVLRGFDAVADALGPAGAYERAAQHILADLVS